MRQSLLPGFLLTLPCLKMYVNTFRLLDNLQNFRKDGLSMVNRSLSAVVLLQITSVAQKWAWNGSDYDASSLASNIARDAFSIPRTGSASMLSKQPCVAIGWRPF